ncbi:MAG: NADH-quinone oxidoreductase subunit NuoK [Desulforhopalus sp.]|uniref:NADH-quinone oxidoreductase subunit NuoK n=1 Tax=Desulforhopalus vacuolatus TaxID=40414 RepID=UPI001964B5F5|nr:NADH-quinone oxidoreductase subunit NuoK [Desulforhopalus vacuolatus]MBM9519473.1 NADH-quinone oxidoreductase subunit NuoK [Desulforhopalus vacuolatus]MCK9174541.1 NADH-quinone oxidoreductase subunit NuoK [Desulforhopalus sp.]
MIEDYLVLSVILFCIGILGVISRRNVFTVLMSIELMLNAANLAFVAFARLNETMDGQILAMMVIAVAAAEAALGLAVIILLHRQKGRLDSNVFSLLKG